MSRVLACVCTFLATAVADFRVKFDVVTTEGAESFTVLVHEVRLAQVFVGGAPVRECERRASAGLGADRRCALQGGRHRWLLR